MKYIQCDFCEKQYDDRAEDTGFFLAVLIPGSYYEDYDDLVEDRLLDVCSPACLLELAALLDAREGHPAAQSELPVDEPEEVVDAQVSYPRVGHLVAPIDVQSVPNLGVFEGQVRVR